MVNNWWCLLAIWLWLQIDTLLIHLTLVKEIDLSAFQPTGFSPQNGRSGAIFIRFEAAEVFLPLTSVEMVMEKNIHGSCKPRWWKRGTLNQSPQTDEMLAFFPGNDQKYDQFKIYKGFLKVDITGFKVPKMDCTDTRVEAFWKEERGSRIGRGKDGGKWQ